MTALSRDEICSFINLIMTPSKNCVGHPIREDYLANTNYVQPRDPGLLSYLLFLISLCLGRTKTLT